MNHVVFHNIALFFKKYENAPALRGDRGKTGVSRKNYIILGGFTYGKRNKTFCAVETGG